MKLLPKELVYQCQLQQEQEERLAFFAEAMCMNRAEAEAAIGAAKALALKTATGWAGALWLKHADESLSGELIHVAPNCHTRKLALIAANFYRLHHLINQADNSTNISPSQ